MDYVSTPAAEWTGSSGSLPSNYVIWTKLIVPTPPTSSTFLGLRSSAGELDWASLIEGSDGSSGTSGTAGTSGTNGSSGEDGSSGINGSSGVNGIAGSNGSSGTSAINGSSGTSGTNGSNGSSGNGSSGTSGTNGSSGSSGINGSSGTSGTNGSSGTNGTSGTNGSRGSSGSSGTSGSSGNGSSGTSGMDGANAVAGSLPSGYTEMTTQRTTTSAVLADITGAVASVTLDSTANIGIHLSGEALLVSGFASTLAITISIDGVDEQLNHMELAATPTTTTYSIVHRTDNPVAAGVHTVQARFSRTAGTGTVGVNSAFLLIYALQGAKGDSGSSGTSGNGSAGTSGNGSAGTSGANGSSGSSGSSGTSGTNGSRGSSGSSGTSGVNGSSGTNGSSGVTPTNAITTDSYADPLNFNMASAANYHVSTLTGNPTLTVSNVSVGQIFVIKLIQDGTGSRTVTWFATIKWVGGTAPTLTTTLNKADTFLFVCTSANNYDGYITGLSI